MSVVSENELSKSHWLQPSFHGHGTDIPPAPFQPSCRLLYGVAPSLCGAGVTVVQQDFTQVQDRGHPCAVLLNVPLHLLQNPWRITGNKFQGKHGHAQSLWIASVLQLWSKSRGVVVREHKLAFKRNRFAPVVRRHFFPPAESHCWVIISVNRDAHKMHLLDQVCRCLYS